MLAVFRIPGRGKTSYPIAAVFKQEHGCLQAVSSRCQPEKIEGPWPVALQHNLNRVQKIIFLRNNDATPLTTTCEMSDTFEREYELEESKGVLVLSQLETGDVNCVVWDAALVLAKYIELRSQIDPEWIKNKRVLELGAGLGCVGLVAACYGGRVTLTDQPKALPLLEHNIKINKEILKELNCTIEAKSLDWNDDCSEKTTCDILLMADCIYYQESIEPLIRIMGKLTTTNTQVILCQEDRSYSDIQKKTWEEFRTKIEKHFTITEIPSTNQHPQYRSSDIMLLQLAKN